MPAASVRRQRKPATHAQGKPVRGIRGPGVRGPAKTQAEIDAEKYGPRPIVITPPHSLIPRPLPAGMKPGAHGQSMTPTPTSRSTKIGKLLSDLIREVGNDVVDQEKGWTRIEAVIRRLYSDALSGKTAAQALLFERGWGRVPMPVKVDLRTELKQVIAEAGLTDADIESDPLLRQLVVIDGTFQPGNGVGSIDAPGEDRLPESSHPGDQSS